MHVKYFVQLLTFLGALLSSNGLKCAGTCNIIPLKAPLGSRVLLPCHLQKSKQTDKAKWSQNSSLLVIRTQGIVTFEDPRDGRVTVFPYMFDTGNFSILIHGLQASDLGTYCCELSQECHRVEIQLSESQTGKKIPWYYIVAGIGGFILLIIACCLTYEFRGMCLKGICNSYYINSPQNQGAIPPDRRKRAVHANTQRAESDGHYEDMEGVGHGEDYENMQGEEHDRQLADRDEEDYVNSERGQCDGQYIVPGGQNERTGHRTSTTVYENDDFICVRRSPQPQNKDLREVSNQSNTTAPYYANQSEIDKAESAGKRKKQRKRKKRSPAESAEYQFRNPIYGDSSVQPKT